MAEGGSAGPSADVEEQTKRRSPVSSALLVIATEFANARSTVADYEKAIAYMPQSERTVSTDDTDVSKEVNAIKDKPRDELRLHLHAKFMEASTLKKRVAALVTEKESLAQKINHGHTVVKVQSDALLKVENKTREALKDLEWKEKQLSSQCADLKADLRKKNDELARMRVECSRLAWQKEDLEKRIDDLNKTNTINEQQLGKLTEECARLRHQLAELESSKQNGNAKLNGHRSQDGSSEASDNGLQLSEEQLDNYRKLLSEKAETMRMQAEEYEKSSRDMKTSLERLRVDIVSTGHSSCESKFVELDRSLRTDLETARMKNKSLKDENASLKEELEKMRNELLNSASSGHSDAKKELLEELRDFVESGSTNDVASNSHEVNIVSLAVNIVSRFLQSNESPACITSTPIYEGPPPGLQQDNARAICTRQATSSSSMESSGQLQEGDIKRLIFAETPTHSQPTRDVIIDEDDGSEQITPDNERIEPFGQSYGGVLANNSLIPQDPSTSSSAAPASNADSRLLEDHAKQSQRSMESHASPPDDIFADKEATNDFAMETERPFDEVANFKAIVNESFEDGELKDSSEEKPQSDDDPFGKHRAGSDESPDPSFPTVMHDDGHSRHTPVSSSTRKHAGGSKGEDENDFKKPQSSLKRRDSRRSSDEDYPRKKTRDDFEDPRKGKAVTEEHKDHRSEASSGSQSHVGHAKRSVSRDQQDAESEYSKSDVLPRIPKLSENGRDNMRPRSNSGRGRSPTGGHPNEDRTQNMLIDKLFKSASSENASSRASEVGREFTPSAKATRQLILNQAQSLPPHSECQPAPSSSRERVSERHRSSRDPSPSRYTRSQDYGRNKNARSSSSGPKHAADRALGRRGRSPPSRMYAKIGSVDALFDESAPKSSSKYGVKDCAEKASKSERHDKKISQGLDVERPEFFGNLHSAKLGMYFGKIGKDTSQSGKAPKDVPAIDSSTEDENSKTTSGVVGALHVRKLPRNTQIAPRKCGPPAFGAGQQRIKMNIPKELGGAKKKQGAVASTSGGSSVSSSIEATPVKADSRAGSPPRSPSMSSNKKITMPPGIGFDSIMDILNKVHGHT